MNNFVLSPTFFTIDIKTVDELQEMTKLHSTYIKKLFSF